MSSQPWTLVGLLAAVRIVVLADPSPGLLPRLLQPFAKRDLVPDSFDARTTRTHDGDTTTRIDITLATMPAEMVHLVLGNLSQTIGVRSVTHLQEITGQISRAA